MDSVQEFSSATMLNVTVCSVWSDRDVLISYEIVIVLIDETICPLVIPSFSESEGEGDGE